MPALRNASHRIVARQFAAVRISPKPPIEALLPRRAGEGGQRPDEGPPSPFLRYPSPVFESLLASLVESGVRYVVVGGLAVVIQGHARLTADVDLVIDLDPENVRRTIAALTARGLRPLLPVDPMTFADETIRTNWIEERNLQVFSLRDERNPLLTVDLFARDPIPFEELWTRADLVLLGGQQVHVASIADLIAMKRKAGRTQDLLDIEQLQSIERTRADDE
jgi:hypothetical protein